MNQQLAFVFPGQGSQSVGMLKELSTLFPIISQTFQEASDTLGYDMANLILNGPETTLNQTEYTQPALLASSVALWRLWHNQDGQLPSLLAGHSLGEYTALVCADALTFTDALQLVAQRGRFMQEAVKEGVGAMAAIMGLENAVIAQICLEAAQDEVVTPANYNSIGQTVIAGNVAAVDRAVLLAQGNGAKMAKKIPVSVPSHCALMRPAAEHLAEVLKSITIVKPKISVLHNVDVKIHEDADSIRSALVQQLYSPVRWVETIQLMSKHGVQVLVECGPGKVLMGLNKRIDANLSTVAINTQESLQAALGGLIVV